MGAGSRRGGGRRAGAGNALALALLVCAVQAAGAPLVCTAQAASAPPGALPHRVATIPLPGVTGRLDHLALDAGRQRLFVAALGSNSVEVVDLARARRVSRREGLREPQGLLFLPERDRLYVTLGGEAAVAVLAGDDLALLRRIPTREDPDNVRLEAGGGHLWVGAGRDGSGVLARLDPDAGAVGAEVGLDGHPESFQLETRSPRAYVNVPAKAEVEVVDREGLAVVARFALPCAANYPMALAEAERRLFVGCRHPARLLLLDTETGRVSADLEAPADADDVFVDAAARRVYVSAGAGSVRVYGWQPPDGLLDLGDVVTAPGARTSWFDAGARRLYVAVPRPAAVQVFVASE